MPVSGLVHRYINAPYKTKLGQKCELQIYELYGQTLDGFTQGKESTGYITVGITR